MLNTKKTLLNRYFNTKELLTVELDRISELDIKGASNIDRRELKRLTKRYFNLKNILKIA